MTAAPDSQPFDLALYIGESREVQRTLVKAVGDLGDDFKEFRREWKQDFVGLNGTVAENSSDIAVLKRDVVSLKETQAKQAETIAPIKLHPIVVIGIILSPILSVAAVVTTVIIAISK